MKQVSKAARHWVELTRSCWREAIRSSSCLLACAAASFVLWDMGPFKPPFVSGAGWLSPCCELKFLKRGQETVKMTSPLLLVNTSFQ